MKKTVLLVGEGILLMEDVVLSLPRDAAMP
jgi:hypothetical protein